MFNVLVVNEHIRKTVHSKYLTNNSNKPKKTTGTTKNIRTLIGEVWNSSSGTS